MFLRDATQNVANSSTVSSWDSRLKWMKKIFSFWIGLKKSWIFWKFFSSTYLIFHTPFLIERCLNSLTRFFEKNDREEKSFSTQPFFVQIRCATDVPKPRRGLYLCEKRCFDVQARGIKFQCRSTRIFFFVSKAKFDFYRSVVFVRGFFLPPVYIFFSYEKGKLITLWKYIHRFSVSVGVWAWPSIKASLYIRVHQQLPFV